MKNAGRPLSTGATAVAVSPEELARVKDLIRRAQANPLSREYLERMSRGFDAGDIRTRPAVADKISQEFTLRFDPPFGVQATFTMEDQSAGLCRHLSLSAPTPGQVPLPALVQLLMALFGFERPLQDCMIWLEEFDPGHQAVNILEPVG
jgi:hypothetical protein